MSSIRLCKRGIQINLLFAQQITFANIRLELIARKCNSFKFHNKYSSTPIEVSITGTYTREHRSNDHRKTTLNRQKLTDEKVTTDDNEFQFQQQNLRMMIMLMTLF